MLRGKLKANYFSPEKLDTSARFLMWNRGLNIKKLSFINSKVGILSDILSWFRDSFYLILRKTFSCKSKVLHYVATLSESLVFPALFRTNFETALWHLPYFQSKTYARWSSAIPRWNSEKLNRLWWCSAIGSTGVRDSKNTIYKRECAYIFDFLLKNWILCQEDDYRMPKFRIFGNWLESRQTPRLVKVYAHCANFFGISLIHFHRSRKPCQPSV